jgi:hypothetical protein
MVGVSDVMVVRAGEKNLVAHKDRLEDVKRIVESMIARPEAMTVSGIRSQPSFSGVYVRQFLWINHQCLLGGECHADEKTF